MLWVGLALSLTLIAIVPIRVNAMPSSVVQCNRSRKKKSEAIPTQSGLVETSAALLATEVYSSELIQLAK